MINWFNMPAEGLSNGGQFEIKELTATENGEYEKDGEVYNKVTVNVEEGGGGDSDFSTAEIQFIISGENVQYSTYILDSDKITMLKITETITCNIPLYKGVAILPLPPGTLSEPPTFSGDVQLSIPDGGIKVTGDGTVTMVGGSIG